MSFSHATAEAKRLSVLHQRTIRLCREGLLFYIEYLPLNSPLDDFFENNSKLQNNHVVKESFVNEENEKYFIEEEEEYEEYAESQSEINFDISNYTESLAQSEEDGWFYSDTDGGWENNIIDYRE
jgi:hypothetical protein